MLLVGTRGGLYGAETVPSDDPELLLDCGQTPRVSTFDGVDGVFATSRSGLYRSVDGREWEDIGVPADEVWEVLVHDGDLYAGTFPARIFRSSDGGETWEELDRFREQPSAPKWRNPFDDDGRVRAMAAHPDAPDRLVVGLEAGGFYRSEDRGGHWARWDVSGQDDFHQIIPLGPAEYVAVCGRLSITDPNHGANEGGLYHTDDAGETWTRLDADLDHSYFREALYHDGRLYAGGSLTIPPVWLAGLHADAALYVSADLSTFEAQPYPGGPDELILAWGVHDGDVVAGTAGGNVFGPGDPAGGRIVREVADGEWEEVGTVPHDVHALLSI